MKLNIAISSGKGGTGKTFISTNIARVLDKMGEKVCYLDCDVEEPNGRLFLKPEIDKKEDVMLLSPMGVDENRCISCGKCASVCKYNALALINNSVLFFKNLCHICGACTIVCTEKAIIEKDRKIGELFSGKSGNIDFHYALLETGEGGMSPRLIKKVKEHIGDGINILDSSPGTACPVVETVKNADLCVLVTDPTPFGINDLKLAVDMCRELGKEPVVIVNRAEYLNDNLQNYCKGEIAKIDPEKCRACGACLRECRFEAIFETSYNDKIVYEIDTTSCEGCGVCGLVCRFDALTFNTAINGQWFVSKTRFGPMSHAKLGASEENSGKLVSLIRNKKNELASFHSLNKSIIDGSPGTGCPVIASITGTDYALVVTEPTVSGIHDLKRVLDVIGFFKIKSGIIVNKYDLNPQKSDEIKEIAKMTGSAFLGEIPYDKSITKAQIDGISVVEYADNEMTRQIKNIWENIKNTCFNHD